MTTMTTQEPPSDFGIRLMDDEQVIFSLRPYRFVKYTVIAAAISVIGIIFIPLVYLWAIIAKQRYHYWLTNKRVIWCHGFIGYQVSSVPLERITDVVIRRSLAEMAAGTSSIVIRDMTGQTQDSTGTGASWVGVQNAPEIQKRVLEEVMRVNDAAKKI